MSYFCFILNYWYCYWYWIFNNRCNNCCYSFFGISLVTYSLLICFFGTTTFFSIDPFLLLAAIIPIKVYSNAEADKDKILKDNKNKSGIYMWKNIINGNQYIGSAIDLSKRLSSYYSTTYMEDALTKGNSHIYRALLKNGHLNFALIILEYCFPEQCIEKEDYYLSCLPHEYNILEKAGSPLGRKHSDKTKTKISDTKKGKPKVEGSGTPSQQIEVTDIKNNTTTYYDSINKATIALNLPNHNIISHYIQRNQKKPYKGRYTFKKI